MQQHPDSGEKGAILITAVWALLILSALAVGFAGTLIIIRPGLTEFSWALAVMLLCALAFGASNVFTRTLAITEDANAVVFYNYLLMGLLALPPALAEWRQPEWSDRARGDLGGGSHREAADQGCRSARRIDGAAALRLPSMASARERPSEQASMRPVRVSQRFHARARAERSKGIAW